MKAFSIYLTPLFFLILSFQLVLGQKVLTQGEYYFNADPGIGNGVSFGFSSANHVEESLGISVGNLDPGFHQLHVRLKDSDGRWGISQNRLFYLESLDNSLPNQPQALEYYIDADPGVGIGNALSFSGNGDFVGEISTSGLEGGFHFLYVRYQDNQGTWGIAQRRMFYLESLDNTLPSQLQALEYYIDTDPGVGIGNALSFSGNGDFVGEISTSGLEGGFHFLVVRYQDNQGNWGIAQRRMFFLESPTEQTNSELTALEYFFNEDPGVGNGVSLNLNSEKEYIGAIETTGLDAGFHRLYVRYRDSQGNWGISQNRLFYLEEARSNEPILIQKIEYFFDEEDPGFGLANPIELSEELPLIDLEALIAVAELDTGGHTLNVRIQDTNGAWSFIESRTFNIESGEDLSPPKVDVLELPQVVSQCIINFEDLAIPTATDDVDGIIQGITNQIFPITMQGNYSITWTYTDAAGNTVTQEQSVIVEDTTAPVPTLAELPVISGQCFVTVTAPIANDNCGGTITGTTTDQLEYSEQGSFIISWTYDDGNGNVISQEQIVVILDTTAPVPDISELPILEEQCSITLIPPTATDNCGGTITGTTESPMTLTEQGYYSITWNYTDQSGNETTQIQEIYLKDIGNPEIYEQGKTFTDECRVELDIPVAFDQCVGEIVGITNDPLIYTVPGTYEVEWIFDDGNGNQSIDIQYVVITGSGIVPSMESLPDLVGDCSVTVTIPTAVASCTGEIIQGSTSDPLSYSVKGTYTITWTYEDGSGNTLIQEQNVIVNDTTAPVPNVVSLPTLIGNCLLEIRTYPTATDNCSGIITAEPDQSPLFTAAGEYTITWTYDDSSGNISQQTQLVIMQTDTQPYWITEPGALDRTLNCPTEEEIQASFFATVPQPGSLCYPVYTQLAGAPVFEPIGTDGSGVYLVTWYYRTPPGIRIDYTARFTVIYGGMPTPVVAELPTLTGECEVEVTDIPKAITCSGTELLATTTDPLIYRTQGTYTITWTYTDGAGNSSSQEQTVIIEDTIAPEIQAPENVTITLNFGESVATEVQLGSPTTSDNCSLVTVSNNAPLSYSVGSTEVIWIATDENGNQSSSIQTVLVNAPACGIQINAQTSVTLILNNKNSATLGVNQVNLGSSSTCGNVSFSLSQTEFSCSDVGENEVLFTVTDVNGNVASSIVLVTIQDVTLPKFVGLPKSIKISLTEGVPYVIPDFSSFVADNCGIVSYSQSPVAGTINTTAGTFDVTVNAADGSENSVSATVSIIRTVPKAKGGKAQRLIPGEPLVISVPWNTNFDEVISEIENEDDFAWIEEDYNPLIPGMYQVKAMSTPQLQARFNSPPVLNILVQDKPKALDIKLSGTTVPNQPKAGDQIAILSTVDPIDDIHTYKIDEDSNLALDGNKLIWKGDGVPAAQMGIAVFSTDRAGQTISKEVTLTRDILPNEFLLYPNPAESETNVMVQLSEGANVEIQLFDAAGRLIVNETAFHEETFVTTFNLDGLAAGLYTVQVKIGWLVMTKRLIKR